MKKSKLLLMTLLVFVLSIALVACGKDEKKDDDDKETSAPKATVEANNEADNKEDTNTGDTDTNTGDADTNTGDADTNTGDADNNGGEDKPDVNTDDATVATLAKNWIGSVIDSKQIESMSMGGKAVLDMTNQGSAIKLNASAKIDVTKSPLVMQMAFDVDGDLAGTPMNMTFDCYAIMEDGEAYIVMNDPTGANEGYFKFAASDLGSSDLVTSMEDMAEAFEGLDFSTIDKDEALNEMDELLAPYEDILGSVKVVEEGDEYVVAGTITEEQINSVIDAAKEAAGDSAAELDSYLAMIPEGYGGIDYRIAFDKNTGAFASAKVDFSKLAKALVGEAGENYVEITFGLDNVSSINVPDAELSDPSMMQ